MVGICLLSKCKFMYETDNCILVTVNMKIMIKMDAEYANINHSVQTETLKLVYGVQLFAVPCVFFQCSKLHNYCIQTVFRVFALFNS